MTPTEVLWMLEEFEEQKAKEDFGGMDRETVEYLYRKNYGDPDDE